ncbi:MAG: hypothetical protein IPN29_18155 [Saprospiraceae bacterium]|nr:hypothetical protein [Saprospiraceae bacterium]
MVLPSFPHRVLGLNFRTGFMLFFLTVSVALSAQLTLRVVSVPSMPSMPENIYVAGNFNGWNPGAAAYKLKKESNGYYTITFTPNLSQLEFKFTMGSWATGEGTAQGGYIANRKLTYTGGPKTVDIVIAGWEGQANTPGTASKNVSLLTDSFKIETLNRYRTIWLYLPPDYQTQNAKRYPVIYMQDGQNLFDRNLSFSGEWRVDESLDSLFLLGDRGCIIVGINHGGSKRIDEYSPWVNAQYGGGEGDEYVDFMVNELKPYIDQHYRTLAGPEFTGIMGSSMGGLISFYAAIKYPNTFGRCAPLSTSYWFSPSVFTFVTGLDFTNFTQKMYMAAGGQEGGNQVGDMERMAALLLAQNYDESRLKWQTDQSAKHNEVYWAKIFPQVYQWLFSDTGVYTNDSDELRLSQFAIEGNELVYRGLDCSPCEVVISDTTGKMVVNQPLQTSWSYDLSALQNLVFVVQVYQNNKLQFSEKMMHR